MSPQFSVFNKCRACLSPETLIEFIHLTGSAAEMFKVVTGFELPIEREKSDSMVCPDCFSELERLRNFKIMTKQAEIFFKLKRGLTLVLERCKENAKQAAAAKPQAQSTPRFLYKIRGVRRSPMRKHSSEKKFCCSKCGFGFKSKSGLTAHKKIHNKSIACSTCPKKFATSKSLKVHQMHHRQGIYATAPEETFDCDKCDKSFSTPHYLKQHQRGVHDDNEVKCEVCDKICKNHESLLKHSRTHAKVECSICKKMVSQYAILRHVRSHSNHFECDLCTYSNNRKDCLKIHIERKHLLVRLVKDSKCREDFCDFELLEELQLKYGSSASLAAKKFTCKKSFETLGILKQHKRRTHPEKLFGSLVCEMAFKTKSNLNHHTASVHATKSVI